MIERRFLLLLPLLACGNLLYSQYTDIAGWADAGVSFRVAKHLDGGIEQGFRYDFSIDQLYESNTDLSLDYKLNKHFKLTGDYRFSGRPETYLNRFSAAITYKKGFHKYDIALRSRVQYYDKPEAPDKEVWRNKFTGTYELKKHVALYVNCELYYTLNYKENTFSRVRYGGGIDWDVTKHQGLDFFYLYQQPLHADNPLNYHIFGISYQFDL